ncbi:hypothetical protein AAG906_029267 [Vitis piasezkii]
MIPASINSQRRPDTPPMVLLAFSLIINLPFLLSRRAYLLSSHEGPFILSEVTQYGPVESASAVGQDGCRHSVTRAIRLQPLFQLESLPFGSFVLRAVGSGISVLTVGISPCRFSIQCGAPVSSSISLQRIPPLHSDSSSLCPSQYCPGADGVQHPKYAIQLGSLPAGGPLCLHHQEGEERHLQHVCPYPVPSIGDQPSGFEQGGSQRACTSQGSLGGLSEHPEREFTSNYSLKLPGTHKRGRLVEWVEKASFDRLNRLFEITSIERKGLARKDCFRLDLSSSSSDSTSRPNNPAEPEDTSSSPQLETFHSGLALSKFYPRERDMNDLRVGFLQRHRKRLYDPIDIAPPPAKRVCPKEMGGSATSSIVIYGPSGRGGF